MQLQCVKTLNNSNHRHRKQIGKVYGTPFRSICHNRKIQNTGLSVQAPSSSDNDKLKVATVVRQNIRVLGKAVLEDKVMMQQNGS
jgi:hypothetical protein